MKTYEIASNIASREYIKNFQNETEARHWVINTLDLSLNWEIKESKIQFNPQ